MCMYVVPVWKVARYLCVHPPYISEMDGYIAQSVSSQPNLTSLGLRRVKQLYGGQQQISSVVHLNHGQFGAEKELLDPCTRVSIGHTCTC